MICVYTLYEKSIPSIHVGREESMFSDEPHNKEILEKAKKIAKSEIWIMENPFDAVKNADIIYTDVWVSMGDEKEKAMREKTFLPYQVNQKLVENAKKNCIVMHCLPAHRGMEITDEVVDGEHSIVFDQAENRLHAQKAVMVKLMSHV
ncbi:MAG: hypothetical protein KJ886_01160 [Candidatus Thermoplasmatota archaeon]|nr:hypothetical protein [Candidatus Thermoplasmatota archaeon]